jgi:hypothetical protein
MGSGRLREHDRDQIALDMIEWAQKEDSLNLNGFCAEQLIAPSKISNWAKEEPFFRQAYEITKAILAERRERRLAEDKLHVKAFDLNASVYDHFLKETRMEIAKFEAMLKIENLDSQSPEVLEKFTMLMAQMKANQEAKSDLTNINAETKS